MNKYCVLVLFNPIIPSFISNIQKLIGMGINIYVYDNSSTTEAYENLDVESRNKIKYYSECKNVGLSKAYNTLLNVITQDCTITGDIDKSYVIFLDQDSELDANSINLLFDTINNSSADVFIVGGNPIRRDGTPYRSDLSQSNEVSFVISSYSVYRISSFDTIGFFYDDFFIDHIDTDFCARVIKAGKKILKLKDATFTQPIGINAYYFFGKYIFPIPATHRTYYQIRNVFLSYKRGGVNLSFLLKEFIIRLIMTILSGVNKKDLLQRAKYFILGTIHGIRC